MGILQHPRHGTFTLPASTRIGRRADNDVPVKEPSVSSNHALIRWNGSRWILRDLGSRNGTWADTEPVKPGEERELTGGEQLTFGSSDGWRLVSAGGPGPEAVWEGGWLAGDSGSLLLPDAEDPSAIIYEVPSGGWLIEQDGEARPVDDGDVVDIGGVAYTLCLPARSSAEASTVNTSDRLLSLDGMRFRFEVSADEETVGIVVEGLLRELDLGARSHHYTLLTLARLRLKDAEHPPSEQGWVERDAFGRMLRLRPAAVNLHLFRARKQLTEAGVLGGGGIIEVRSATREIRLGVPVERLSVEVAGG